MKKAAFLLLSAVLLLSFLTACGGGSENASTPDASQPPTQSDATALRSSPRLSPDFVGELVPSKKYGKLLPYLGKVGTDAFGSYGLYGLCREDGTIVVDPVYSEVSYNDGYYLLLKSDAPKPVEGDGFSGRYYLIPEDGSSVRDFGENTPVFCLGDGVYCYSSLLPTDNGYDVNTSYCSADGKTLLEDGGDVTVSDFHDGIALLTRTDKNGTTQFFADTSLNEITPVSGAESVSSDCPFYKVTDADGKIGVYRNNIPVLAPEYDAVGYSPYNGGIVALRDGTAFVFDPSLTLVAQFPVAENAVTAVTVGPDFVRYYPEGASPVCVDKNGRLLDADELGYLSNCGLYYRRSGVTEKDLYVVFDRAGKDVFTVPAGWYVDEYASVGNFFVIAKNTSGSGDFVLEYALVDPSTGKTTKLVGSFYGSPEAYLRRSKDAAHIDVLSPENLSVIYNCRSFFGRMNTSVGELVFYDVDGFFITAAASSPDPVCVAPSSEKKS